MNGWYGPNVNTIECIHPNESTGPGANRHLPAGSLQNPFINGLLPVLSL